MSTAQTVLIFAAGAVGLALAGLTFLSYYLYRKNKAIVAVAMHNERTLKEFLTKPVMAIFSDEQFTTLTNLIRHEVQNGLSLKKDYVN